MVLEAEASGQTSTEDGVADVWSSRLVKCVVVGSIT